MPRRSQRAAERCSARPHACRPTADCRLPANNTSIRMPENASVASERTALGKVSAVRDHVRLMRPSHWLKNTFVFTPLVFGKALSDSNRVLSAVLAFTAFCLVSSAVYVVNDIADRAADAEHPHKRNRPIASGRVGLNAAWAHALLLLLAAVGVVVQLRWQAMLLVGVYAVLNAAYSFGLKHVVLVDIFIIAGGFMLRVLAGAQAIDVEASQWLVICTMFLSLFLAIAKRRSEINHMGRGDTRKVLDDYTPELVRLIMNVSVAGTVMSYTLYTVSDHTREFFGTGNFIYTVPIVVYGIFRYLYLDEKKRTAENPVAVVLSDPGLILCLLAWVGASILIIYLR